MNIEELEKKIVEAIKEIYDPEIPINIYELGLIYDVAVTAENEVVVLMTLTAPNCPEAEGIPIQVEQRIMEIPEITKVKVLVTFEPPWDRDMMSESAKFALGFF
ncbi:MAG: hypothetical protein QG635_1950 [Bacteroidota bacterium]|nr:hypothetical protein [Bacteroidota bacterium]